LSHDLREPLRSIVGFSQLASKKIDDNSDVQEYLKFVIGSGKQLEQLINSINVFEKANVPSSNEIRNIRIPELRYKKIILIKKLNYITLQL